MDTKAHFSSQPGSCPTTLAEDIPTAEENATNDNILDEIPSTKVHVRSSMYVNV